MALPWTNKIIGLESQVANLTALIEGTGLYTLAKDADGKLALNAEGQPTLTPTQKATELFALGDVSAELAQANTHLKEATDSNVELQGKVNKFEAAFPAGGHFAFADGKVSLTDAGKTAFVNAAVTTTVAAAGHAPLPAAAASASVDTTGQTAAPKLTGRDRLKAETRKEFAAKTAVTITV